MRNDPKIQLRGLGKLVAFPVETETSTAATTPTLTTTTARRSYLAPRVRVEVTRLWPAESEDGVTVKVQVTNCGSRPLKMTGSMLISVEDGIPLDDDVDVTAAWPLLRTPAPDKSVTGTLRFSTSPAVTQRLTDNLGARLRIATRTITMKLTTDAP